MRQQYSPFEENNLKNQYLKIGAMGALMALAAGCSTMGGPPANEAPPVVNPNFATEMNKFNAQFPNDKATKYEEISLNYNNAQKLDERGSCHDLSKYPVVIVLTLDAQGKVTAARFFAMPRAYAERPARVWGGMPEWSHGINDLNPHQDPQRRPRDPPVGIRCVPRRP